MPPIKRHPALIVLSREHHHSLLLCWKIRAGIAKKISVERIKKYCDWFYDKFLLKHFEVEEQTLSKIMSLDTPRMRQMVEEHSLLHQLFEDNNSIEALENTANTLEAHVRFEERDLFNAIQEKATEDQLHELALSHQEEKFDENTEDEFWKRD